MFSSGGTLRLFLFLFIYLFFGSSVCQKVCKHVCKVLGKHINRFLIYGLRVKLTQPGLKYS